MSIINHNTEELRKLEMERQELWDKLKKALNLFNNSPSHKTLSDMSGPVNQGDIDELIKKVANSKK